jgi:hypothetical protein
MGVMYNATRFYRTGSALNMLLPVRDTDHQSTRRSQKGRVPSWPVAPIYQPARPIIAERKRMDTTRLEAAGDSERRRVINPAPDQRGWSHDGARRVVRRL